MYYTFQYVLVGLTILFALILGPLACRQKAIQNGIKPKLEIIRGFVGFFIGLAIGILVFIYADSIDNPMIISACTIIGAIIAKQITKSKIGSFPLSAPSFLPISVELDQAVEIKIEKMTATKNDAELFLNEDSIGMYDDISVISTKKDYNILFYKLAMKNTPVMPMAIFRVEQGKPCSLCFKNLKLMKNNCKNVQIISYDELLD